MIAGLFLCSTHRKMFSQQILLLQEALMESTTEMKPQLYTFSRELLKEVSSEYGLSAMIAKKDENNSIKFKNCIS